MIIITGAAGFIGSCLISELNKYGFTDLVLVDVFDNPLKLKNLEDKVYLQQIHRQSFIDTWFEENANEIDFVFHIGARTDTTEKSVELFNELNLHYTQKVWTVCSQNNIPLVYASSAATYGLGEHGYIDSHDIVSKLSPLNPYGDSKNDFDKWALKQEKTPPFWAGLKFFNVYGPNEYHKGRMASVVFHAFHQINKTDAMKLFRSHRSDFKDGQQSRDFIYVKDLIKVCLFLMKHQPKSGLYNVGTGTARSFYDLVVNTFNALNKIPQISFIDTPIDIRDNYQYFTEANMEKLQQAGYQEDFYSLEEGIKDYVQNYLMTDTRM